MEFHTHRTAPLETAKMPPGIAFIIGNEAAEHFFLEPAPENQASG
jgi:hypothetical protein